MISLQEAFNKKESNGAGGGGAGDEPKKRIHVRSKDPSRIARQLEKSLKNGSSSKSSKGSKVRRSTNFIVVCLFLAKTQKVLSVSPQHSSRG